MSASEYQKLAREIVDLRRRLDTLSTPQLRHSSLENGALLEYDEKGQLVGQIGKQFDGTHAAVSLAGPTPPAPSTPKVEGDIGSLLITINGTFLDDITVLTPQDFARFEIHLTDNPALRGGISEETFNTEVTSPRGGTVAPVVNFDTPYYVWIVTRSLSGKPSAPSPIVGPVAARRASAEDLEIDFDAIGGNKIYRQDFEPAGDHKIGDLWLKTPENVAYRFEGDSGWVESRDQGVAQAIDDAFAANTAAEQAGLAALGAQDAADAASTAAGNAQSTANAANTLAAQAKTVADSKITVYRQATAPSGGTYKINADLWIDSDDGLVYYASTSSGGWLATPDQRIATALTNAGTAQSTANSKTTVFAQVSAPSTTGRTVGDIWIDTDDGNAIYDWPSTGGWTKRALGAAAISATARQLGAIMTYRQATAPASGMIVGDFWIDSDDNQIYRYEGSTPTWVASRDVAINTAITNAATAQATADGKMRIFPQASAPAGLVAGDVGDLWIDTDDGNKSYTWALISGTTYGWVARTIGNSAITPNSLTARDVIATGTISAALFESVMILATTIILGNQAQDHTRIDNTGVAYYANDPVDGIPNEVSRLGRTMGIRNPTTGNVVALINQDGRANFQRVESVEDPIFGGTLLSQSFSQKLSGCPVWGQAGNASARSTGAELGFWEFQVTLPNNRLFKLNTSHMRMTGSVDAQLGVMNIRWTWQGGTELPATPTVGSPMLTRVFVPMPYGVAGAVPPINQLFATPAGTGWTTYRFLLTNGKVFGSGDLYIDANGVDNVQMWVEDLGPLRQPTTVPNNGGGQATGGAPTSGGSTTPVSTAKQYDQTFGNQWTRTWRANGTYRTDTSDALQGYGDSFNGNQVSMIGWGDLTPYLTGANIQAIQVYLYCHKWWQYSGGVAILGVHGNLNAPETLVNTAGNLWQVGGWPNAAAKWLDIPSNLWGGFQNGGYRGILLGPGPSSDTQYYGRFAGGFNSSLIRIVYTK